VNARLEAALRVHRRAAPFIASHPASGRTHHAGDIAAGLLTRLLAPRGNSVRLSVLVHHRVLARPDPFYPEEPTAASFDTRMAWVKARFNVLPLGEAVTRMQAGTLPERALAITFDDGYADNHDVALPILRKHGLPATFFIATGYIDGGILFNDVIVESLRQARTDVIDLDRYGVGVYRLRTDAEKHAAFRAIDAKIKAWRPERREALLEELVDKTGATVPTNGMLTSEQIVTMRRAGMEIGGHTVSHPILTSLAPREAEREIQGCKRTLETILDERVDLFAYPNGLPGQDYRRKHVDMVRAAGYRAAASTAWGASGHGADPYQLRRFTPQTDHDLHYELRLLRNMWARGNVLA
jgi:peptidoglycan/xylan/chitin deacetylase (PgdA/CDA1 family)